MVSAFFRPPQQTYCSTRNTGDHCTSDETTKVKYTDCNLNLTAINSL